MLSRESWIVASILHSEFHAKDWTMEPSFPGALLWLLAPLPPRRNRILVRNRSRFYKIVFIKWIKVFFLLIIGNLPTERLYWTSYTDMHSFTKHFSFYTNIVCTLSINDSFLWFGSPIKMNGKIKLKYGSLF